MSLKKNKFETIGMAGLAPMPMNTGTVFHIQPNTTCGSTCLNEIWRSNPALRAWIWEPARDSCAFRAVKQKKWPEDWRRSYVSDVKVLPYINGLFPQILIETLATGPTFSAEKTFKIGSPWGAKTLDVQKEGFLWMRLGVIEGLTDADHRLRLQPALAESWRVSKDKKEWTFKLRSNVRFHDGTLFTSAIMKDCLTRLMQKGALLKNVPIETIEAPDDRTLTIATSVPFAPLPAYLSKGEAAALAPSSFDAQGEVIQPVGTGFFKFESWKVKEEVVLSA